MPVPWGFGRPQFGNSNERHIRDCAMKLRHLRSLQQYIMRLCKVGVLKYPDDMFNRDRGVADKPIRWSKITQHEINGEIIKKIIPKQGSCSWSEMVSPAELQTRDFFCSHSWSEPFREFMATIERFVQKRKVTVDQAFWICVYANDQWNVELGETLATSPFFETLKGAKETLVMLDRSAEVLGRLWVRTISVRVVPVLHCLERCVFEMSGTKKLNQTIVFWTSLGRVGSALVCSGPVVQALENLKTATAEASDAVDERRIKNYIAGVDEMEGITRNPAGQPMLEGAAALEVAELEQTLSSAEGNAKAETERSLKEAKSAMQAESAKYSKQLEKQHECEFESLDDSIREFAGAAMVQRTAEATGTTVGDATLRGLMLKQLRRLAQDLRGWLAAEASAGREVMGEHCVDGVWEKTRVVTWEDLSLHDICHSWVNPRTKERQCSYMELVASGPQPADYHINHWWGTPFKDTMSALEWHAEAMQLPDTTVYWLDTFSMNHHIGELEDKAFYRSVSSDRLSGVLSVLDENAQTMTRGWPMYELDVAWDNKKSVDLLCSTGCVATTRPFADGLWEFGNFDAQIGHKVLETRVQDVKCAHLQDKLMILNSICKLSELYSVQSREPPPTEHPAYDKFNMRLHRAAAGPALRQAASTGNTEQAADVFDKCPGLLACAPSLRGVLGEAPIHVAASSGHSAVLQMLLEAKANPNAQDLAGETPLHYCAIAGQATTAKVLLQAGADPTIESFLSETAMEVAQQELAYWLVDTAKVKSVLGSRVAAPEAVECRTNEELKAALAESNGKVAALMAEAPKQRRCCGW